MGRTRDQVDQKTTGPKYLPDDLRVFQATHASRGPAESLPFAVRSGDGVTAEGG